MQKNELIYGTRAVIEAILAGRDVEKVWFHSGNSNELIRELKILAKAHHVPMVHTPMEKINRAAPGKNHQGVLGFLAAVSFASLDNLVDRAFAEGRFPFLVMIDRITDVRNFGAIARTAECMGVDGLVITDRGNAPINSDAVKTSAGALHHLPVCRSDDPRRTLKELRNSGLLIVACTEKAAKPIWSVELVHQPVVLLIGNEESGISEPLLKESDELVKIPMYGKVASLNASVAAGIAIYEVARQRWSANG